jgi:hypothetical protein
VSSPWWAAFGPAETQISCGEGTHTVRWAGGALQAVEHEDAEGELVLAALGGDTTPCLSLIQSWGRHSDDLAVLSIGPRSATDQLTITPGWLDDEVRGHWPGLGLPRSMPMIGRGQTATSGASAAFAGRGRAMFLRSTAGVGPVRPKHLPRRLPSPLAMHRLARGLALGGPAESDPRAELFELLALGLPFQLRLSAAVAHAWSADGQHASRVRQARPSLTAALAGRAAPAAAAWRGIDASKVDVSLREGPGWGAADWVSEGGERRLLLTLPVDWLARVWAPGLVVVGGHLVIGVQAAAWPEAQVMAVGQPGAAPVPLSIRQAGLSWVVTA